ncbi:perlucin-like [Haliotis rubra]|uniref:perlucin-like n=1 Tax=Haliotis rubra TaxID=36100 RepID=UPI001EE614AE|nr:perlucin-like [Haliotis rubra]
MSPGLVFVLLCALASVTAAEDRPRCPRGFLEHGSSCYWFSNIEGSFAEASSYCQFFGSHLARITSEDEDDYLRSRANEEKGSIGYWLGATDLIKEGEFMWEGGVPLNYTNWAPGEPNNEMHPEQSGHCLMLQMTTGYKWNDNDCIKKTKFICERKVSMCCCKH